jgi:dephospho-CoA kinase
MYIIGLTGNIATGKSTIMRILGELGAQVVDADLVAHELMQPGGSAYLKIIGAFGSEVVASDGSIDRKWLGEVVFNDFERLQALEKIVHPLVAERIAAILSVSDKPVVVIEAIKLIEAGLNALCNEVWVVTSAKETQIKRLRDTRKLKRSEALLRINAQPSQAEKIKAADVVLKDTIEALRRQVEEQWARVQKQLAVAPQASAMPSAEN